MPLEILDRRWSLSSGGYPADPVAAINNRTCVRIPATHCARGFISSPFQIQRRRELSRTDLGAGPRRSGRSSRQPSQANELHREDGDDVPTQHQSEVTIERRVSRAYPCSTLVFERRGRRSANVHPSQRHQQHGGATDRGHIGRRQAPRGDRHRLRWILYANAPPGRLATGSRSASSVSTTCWWASARWPND